MTNEQLEAEVKRILLREDCELENGMECSVQHGTNHPSAMGDAAEQHTYSKAGWDGGEGGT